MSFIEFLNCKGIGEHSEGYLGIIYKIMAAYEGDEDYRSLSIFFADIQEMSDAFEKLWNDYECHLDSLQYEPAITRSSDIVM